MFDKLIESNSVEADFKPRGRYFTVSSVIVGILFLTAVVVSLYAQDLDLGTDNFDVAELLTPVAPEAPRPPEPARQTPQNTSQTSNLPQVTESIARMDESPKVPDGVAVTSNSVKEHPIGKYTIGLTNIDSSGPSGGSERGKGTGSLDSSTVDDSDEISSTAVKPVPPPIKVSMPPKRPVSIGVVNGNATYLPKPPYSQAAILVGAQGAVTVQVTIDETGKVISSKAVSGHVMLRGPSEKAAWSAKFTPTLLSNVPVKVTGVIVYKFAR